MQRYSKGFKIDAIYHEKFLLKPPAKLIISSDSVNLLEQIVVDLHFGRFNFL